MLKKLAGVTVIELLLVLAVIAAILLGSTKLYQVVDNNRKVNDAANMVLAVYQAGAQYDTLPTDTDDLNLIKEFVDQGYLTSDFEKATANPWGGNIQATAPAANQLKVTMSQIPLDLCSNLSAKFTKMNNATPDDCGGVDPATFGVLFNMDYTSDTSTTDTTK